MQAFNAGAGLVREASSGVPPSHGTAEREAGETSCFPAYAAADVDRGTWKGVAWSEEGVLEEVPVEYQSANALKSGRWQARNPEGSPVTCEHLMSVHACQRTRASADVPRRAAAPRMRCETSDELVIRRLSVCDR